MYRYRWSVSAVIGAPAEVIDAEHALPNRPSLAPATVTLEHGLERSTAQVAGHGRLREIENRRNEIYVLDDVADAPACAGAAGLLYDQRHVDRLVVHEESMLLFAVIAQPFAVIRQQDNRRTIVELVRLQIANQPADDFVRVRNLAVVWRVVGVPAGGAYGVCGS